MDEERLKSIPLFASLSKGERQLVARNADEVDVKEGTEFVREGETAYEFFVIERGSGEVRRGDEVIDRVGPGDFLGEMGLLAKEPRNASVIATSPMTVVVMTGPMFNSIEREMPAVAAQIRAAVQERSARLERSG